MKNKTVKSLTLVFLFMSTISLAQNSYMFHSHNDYLQNWHFWEAYTHRAGSIEADVFLKNNSLYVARTEKEFDTGRILENLYLEPIAGLARCGKLRELQ